MDLLENAFLTVFGQGLVQLVTQKTSSTYHLTIQICTLIDVDGYCYMPFQCRDEKNNIKQLEVSLVNKTATVR